MVDGIARVGGRSLDEFELIARLFAPLARGEAGAFDLTDDAAVLEPKAGHDIVLTTDAIVEGVHFLPDDPPETIAQKALRVNLSDLAAKGAAPRAYLLTLAVPASIDDAWLKAFAGGLKRDQKRFAVTLIEEQKALGGGMLADAQAPEPASGHVPAFLLGSDTATSSFAKELGTAGHIQIDRPMTIRFRREETLSALPSPRYSRLPGVPSSLSNVHTWLNFASRQFHAVKTARV